MERTHISINKELREFVKEQAYNQGLSLERFIVCLVYSWAYERGYRDEKVVEDLSKAMEDDMRVRDG